MQEEACPCQLVARPGQETRLFCSQESPSPLPFATIPRIRAGFRAWPHTSSHPLGPTPTSQLSLFLPMRWKWQGSCVPSTCTNRGKVLPQHPFHVLSILCQAQVPHRCRCPPEAPLLDGLGLFLPWSVMAKFPWPCMRGPWARAVGVGSFGFHVGSEQEGLSCGCHLDSWAWPRSWQCPTRGSCSEKNILCLGACWWDGRTAGQSVRAG